MFIVGGTMVNNHEWREYYLNILESLGIYSTLDEKQFNIIYKRYRKIGGRKVLFFHQIKKETKK